MCQRRIALWCLVLAVSSPLLAEDVEKVSRVEGQPLAANISRVVETLGYLGSPLSPELIKELDAAGQARDVPQLQKLFDPLVAFVVLINPENRVKVRRGPGKVTIQQSGFTPLLVKVINQSTIARPLVIKSPQAGPLYAGASGGSLVRQAQTELNENENTAGRTDRFLNVEMYTAPPMTKNLSGLEGEYAIALIASSEAGKREGTIEFNVGQGTQDLGFRGEVPVLFDVQPAIPVKLAIHDVDDTPTVARLTIRDRYGRVYPPQAKRLAPDFFFQQHIYRADGETVILPPGKFLVTYCRGPEYLELQQELTVPEKGAGSLSLKLKRWIDPQQHGLFSGDHHIHGAGCSHYEMPTKGVRPEDMFAQVKGEGLNVGCVLTWGPCYEFQRQYFKPFASEISQPFTLLKYDIEVSGFGSQALGHVCLLNLKEQTYPGSDGTKDKGWPTWTVPVLKWCKDQGGVTGYPHSALHVNAIAGAQRMLAHWDMDKDGSLSPVEAERVLIPESFAAIDADKNGQLSDPELVASFGRAAQQLPNFAIPDMNAGGALEICVSTAEGVCDFISAMDTARIPEWNTWYHLMNCGFPLKVSGETDFPCMSSLRVGQGRVYVRLGKVDHVDYGDWCDGLGQGRSYVSDGFAHALEFAVNDVRPGESQIKLDRPGTVKVKSEVSFAPYTPVGVAYGTQDAPVGRRMLGDTTNLHVPRSYASVKGGERLVELVVNGVALASQTVPADGKVHALEFDVPIERSSWVALRHFPQLHTNPVDVLVAGQPIRASRASARWCLEAVRQLWELRHIRISEAERPAAKAAYDRAMKRFEQIAGESP